VRLRSERDFERRVPVHVVWEITLACNLSCSHCGSRAGKRRPNELDTAAALDLVDALARLGTRELTIIGGEAFLRPDWCQIVARASSHGIYCAMQTGALALTDRRLHAGVNAGLKGLGVSLDGLQPLHDRLRGRVGTFDSAVGALRRARQLGLRTSVNTQIGPQTLEDLPGLLDVLVQAGVEQWQIQLTVAMGNAVDNPDLLLQPYQLLELMPLLAELSLRARREGVSMVAGNNVGYFGPHEHLWRQGVDAERQHWSGCSAGETTMGIESDGAVKGCPSLPTVGYAGGNVRDLELSEIWSEGVPAVDPGLRSPDKLWGFCGSCYYADVCTAGCTWTADALFGRPGNNPYCHYRTLRLAEQGVRERVVKVQDAADTAFATGRFELVQESLDGSAPLAPGLSPGDTAATARPGASSAATRVTASLRLCLACYQYVRPDEVNCPMCGVELSLAEEAYDAERRRRKKIMADVRDLVDQAQSRSRELEGRAH